MDTTAPAPTSEEFCGRISTFTISATSANATGLLAPFTRAMGHMLFALASINSTPITATTEEVENELRSAKVHLDATITVEAPALTDGAHDRIIAYRTAVGDLVHEWYVWDNINQSRALLAVINLGLSVACYLDRELAGIPIGQSNPGSSL